MRKRRTGNCAGAGSLPFSATSCCAIASVRPLTAVYAATAARANIFFPRCLPALDSFFWFGFCICFLSGCSQTLGGQAFASFGAATVAHSLAYKDFRARLTLPISALERIRDWISPRSYYLTADIRPKGS